jgi:hypothetical protein
MLTTRRLFMAERIQRRNERKWYWDEVDPKTKTIVGALQAAELPLSKKPSLEKITASAAMEGFGVSLEHVRQTWERSIKEFADAQGLNYDTNAVPKAIIDGLRACEPKETMAVISELGRCAGRGSWAAELASETSERILTDGGHYTAIPALKALSTLAMYRLALEEGPGPVHVAEAPESAQLSA